MFKMAPTKQQGPKEKFLKKVQSFSDILYINRLNTELNPICHLLALLRAHHILHVSRIRVKFKNILNLSDVLSKTVMLLSGLYLVKGT
jgi:hypothetical protein